MQKTIGITGSQGLIGSCLCSHFLAKGHTVIGIDNLSRYGEVERNHDHEKKDSKKKSEVKTAKEKKPSTKTAKLKPAAKKTKKVSKK